MDEKDEGDEEVQITSYKKQSWGCKVQHRDIVNNTVITVYGAKRVLDSE